tara:strand:- start:255 stop:374 length:120 start_codon:yes stop_codon:yes gene_type:complete
MKKLNRADRQFAFLKWMLKINNKYIYDKKQMHAAYNKIK